uniref:T9SS type A sorting domain-containing protein n=1 Tax=Ignavibacterium album TaxID=591197 RepID=A0A7V2ZM09_9BACT
MKINYFSFLILLFLYINPLQVHPQNFWRGVQGPDGGVNYHAINSNGYIFISGGCGFLRSTDDGESWTGQAPPSLFSFTAIATNSLNHVFVGTMQDGIYRSSDNGMTWVQINEGLTSLYVYSLVTHQNDDVYAGLYYDVCKSTNNGNSWSPTNLGATFVNTLGINSSGVLFAGANLQGVYKSTDNGATWSVCSNGLTTANIFTLSINTNDDIYLGTVNGGAFRSTDEGNSWIQIGLNGYQVQCFAFTPSGEIFSGTNNGVFKSTDNGTTWTHISNNGLSNPYVYCLFFNSAGYLFAGTGVGLCKSVEPVITSVDDSIKNIPRSFILFQNYPNPFNPSTTISWQSPVGSWQTIKLYDLLGREIETIVNGYYEAGSHSTLYIINSSLPGGVYFYQLKAGKYLETKKMILLK